MARRTLLKAQDRQELFDIPVDEDSLIRHYSLSPADRLEIELRRRKHNQLGFAVQLCLMRYPGRALLPNEIPPSAMLNYVAEQIDADRRLFAFTRAARKLAAITSHICCAIWKSEAQPAWTVALRYGKPSRQRQRRTRARRSQERSLPPTGSAGPCCLWQP